jgi:hypothetical protein
MCTSSPFSCLGSPRQCVSLHPHVGRAGICLCAGPSCALLSSTTRPYEKPVLTAGPRNPCVCQEGIAELPISDPAQLAVVVVVDGAGIGRAQVVDSVHVLADRVCRVALWCVSPLSAGPRGRLSEWCSWSWCCRTCCPLPLVILCEGPGVSCRTTASPCVSVTLASSMFLAASFAARSAISSRRSHCAPGP